MNKLSQLSFVQAFNTILTLAMIVMLSGCAKEYVPKEQEVMDPEADYLTKSFSPLLERTTLIPASFNYGNTSTPVTFSILNIRNAGTGEPASELTDKFPVKVWSQSYTGKEQSLAEIEAKRTTEYHSLFEVRDHAGDFVFWGYPNSSTLVQSNPQPGYLFDVKVTNKGGTRYFRDMKLVPNKPIPYTPSNFDHTSGMQLTPYTTIGGLLNVKGAKTGGYIGNVQVSFHKIIPKDSKIQSGTSLTFRFFDTLYNPIKLTKFNTTKWATLIHGFNPVWKADSTSGPTKVDSAMITYQVAYPIPLITYPTAYTTSDGTQALAMFTYSRIGFGGLKEDAVISFPFSIYESGDWEVDFWFKDDVPQFENN
ncbi:DUF5007 domain-containing protein [Chitinophagaceae bacterium 26-R-25]|nr:DUF5007 domain-containing protein [Chitinophagaceae bacterium 26-R-25]